MLPFYALVLIILLASSYIRSKHGRLARIRKTEKDIEEITKLELTPRFEIDGRAGH